MMEIIRLIYTVVTLIIMAYLFSDYHVLRIKDLVGKFLLLLLIIVGSSLISFNEIVVNLFELQ